MRSGSRRIAVLLASVLLAGPVRPALAQPASPKQKASDLVKKAIARSEAGDHQGAIKLYNDAYDLAPNSLLLSNIGAQYQELGQWEDALEYFCRYLKEDPGGVNAAYARSQAKIVQRQLGRKRVDSKDPCAPAPPPPPPPPTEDVTDRPRPTEDTAGPKRPTRPRSNPAGTEATEEEGGPGTVRPAPPPPPRPPADEPPAKVAAGGNPVLMYTGLASGIAGLAAAGIGVYYGIQGKSISDQINSHPKDQPWQDDIRAKMNEGERDNRLQVGTLIASGVLVTAGVVLYVVGRPDAPEHATDKVVRVAPTANGLVVFGRF